MKIKSINIKSNECQSIESLLSNITNDNADIVVLNEFDENIYSKIKSRLQLNGYTYFIQSSINIDSNNLLVASKYMFALLNNMNTKYNWNEIYLPGKDISIVITNLSNIDYSLKIDSTHLIDGYINKVKENKVILINDCTTLLEIA